MGAVRLSTSTGDHRPIDIDHDQVDLLNRRIQHVCMLIVQPVFYYSGHTEGH